MELRAHGKVNLGLRVLGKREDGFHEVATVYQSVGLADLVRVEPLDRGVEIVMEGPGSGISAADNIVTAAARLLARHAEKDAGARITIDKRLPVAGGMGGGSADAAATLVALNDLWHCGLDETALSSLAAEIGSDVPFLIGGGTAMGTGRGEVLESLSGPPEPLWLVFAFSETGLSTADVYAACEPGAERDLKDLIRAVASGDPAEVARCLHNDLEPAALALRSELASMKERLLDAGALGAMVSGSGPTVFGVARDRSHAEEIASALARLPGGVAVAASGDSGVERLDS